jgi:hypothetical protein
MRIKQPALRTRVWLSAVGATVIALCEPPSGSAGIQGSGLRRFAAVGAVTGTGPSLSVGGTQYTDSDASVEVDGNPSTESKIRLGELVVAYGHASIGKPDVIDHLVDDHAVRGYIDSVDVTGGTFVAAGQTIIVNASTVFGTSLLSTGLSSLAQGTAVEVSGWPDATGMIVASRIDLLARVDITQVVGQVSSLDPVRHRFRINQLTVDVSEAEIDGTLQEGAEVRVQGAGFDQSGTLLADTVEIEQPLQVSPGNSGRLEGVVTTISSTNSFEVDGEPVELTQNTKMNANATVRLNARIKVSGVFDTRGVLVAEKLEVKGPH